MRRLLPLLLASTALALPVQAKDLTIGMGLEPPHLDPTAGAAAAIDEVVFLNTFEGLVRLQEDGSITPLLAESFTISDDGLTYTFDLVEGVTFHDGSSFDAADVVYSFDRARGEDSPNAKKGFFEPIVDIEAPDDGTVVLTLSAPSSVFLFRLTTGDAAIVPEGMNEELQTNPIGTGPYQVSERLEGDRVILTPYDGYRDPSKQNFDEVTFRFISDAAAQVAALLAGDLDAFPNIGAPENLIQFEADPRFNVVVGTTEGETVMALNPRREPFDNPLVRQAIMHALDRQEIVDGAMFGYGTPIGSHFAPHHPAYVDLTGVYPHDPDRARELLAEAGLAEGFEATFILPPPSYARRGGEIIQQQLADVGIDVTLEPVEWGQWLENAFRGYNYDMTIVSHTEALDIDIYAQGPDYYFGWEDDGFNAVIEQIKGETDPDALTALYGDAQQILAEGVGSAFIFQLAKHGVMADGLVGMWANAPIQANDITGASWE